MERPSGTVTFLFTDIAGSCRLWERDRVGMSDALKLHDDELRSVFESCGGYVFKSVGDALCAAFSLAPQALSAAIEAQICTRALFPANSADEDAIRIEVRMAIHTGDAIERDDDYFGPSVNRVARLRDVGHGGQILLSQASQLLVREALPDGCRLRDMGLHRLRDLHHEEHIYQVVAAGIDGDFAPLRTLENLPNNLPSLLTSFIGREREISQVSAATRNGRLVTLTGAGGCGKTRLALHVGADLLDEFADGVWLVELAGIAEPSAVASAVAAAFRIPRDLGGGIADLLRDHVGGQTALLILDNCEHLLDASADIVRAILKSCPNVKILATSREALALAGEAAIRVPPLSMPPADKSHTLKKLHQFEAVALFRERAQLCDSTFCLTKQNSLAVVQICRRLDGLPLALELAAAYVDVLTPEQIAQHLDDRFRLLVSGARGAEGRHQTLRATIRWSHELLSGDEQSLFRKLAIFSGGWSLEAAATVCSGEIPDSLGAVQGLRTLVAKSLVVAEDQGTEKRYRMLESVREFGMERLRESAELQQTATSHLFWFSRLVARAEPELHGKGQKEWLQRLESEHDNLRSALQTGIEAVSTAETALAMAASLWSFWHFRGYAQEGRVWLDRALSACPTAPPTLRSKALNQAGNLALNRGEYASARDLHEHALVIRRTHGDRLGEAGSLNNLGIASANQGDFGAARDYYEQSEHIYRELGDSQRLAQVLINLGAVATDTKNWQAARDHLHESLELLDSSDDRLMIASVLSNRGIAERRSGDLASARESLAQALEIRFEHLDERGCCTVIAQLALTAVQAKDFQHAARMLGAYTSLSGRWDFRQTLVPVKEIGEARVELSEVMEHSAQSSAHLEGAALDLGGAVSYCCEWAVSRA